MIKDYYRSIYKYKRNRKEGAGDQKIVPCVKFELIQYREDKKNWESVPGFSSSETAIDMIELVDNGEAMRMYLKFVAEDNAVNAKMIFDEKIKTGGFISVSIYPNPKFTKFHIRLYRSMYWVYYGDCIMLDMEFDTSPEMIYIVNDDETLSYNTNDFGDIARRVCESHIITKEEQLFINSYNNAIEISNGINNNANKSNINGKYGLGGLITNGNKPIYQKLVNTRKNEKIEMNQELELSDEEKKIFNPSDLTINSGLSNSAKEFNSLIGLGNVKREVEVLKKVLSYRSYQKERGIHIESQSSLHMCFTGAPGTGKTTVARIITGILFEMGYIKDNKCVEINGENMKAIYEGQTSKKTEIILRSAKERVLFIDEAYSLVDNYANGYGKDVISTLLKGMEDNRHNTIIIFAGYEDEMKEFLKMNAGLKSRINRHIKFDNYSPIELCQIMLKQLNDMQIMIDKDALQKCCRIFKIAACHQNFSNARFARNLVDKIMIEHAFNVRNVESDSKRKVTIMIEDIPDAVVNELLTKTM